MSMFVYFSRFLLTYISAKYIKILQSTFLFHQLRGCMGKRVVAYKMMQRTGVMICPVFIWCHCSFSFVIYAQFLTDF